MTTTGAQPWVADLYDAYVTTTADLPFWLDEARRVSEPVLELMTGTGRISLPLVEAGTELTCVELSGSMLDRLRAKLAAKGLRAETVEMDVSRLILPAHDYALALLPFQSFGELLTPEAQQQMLAAVAAHLRPGGRFICTLHNPAVRRRTIDGRLRLLGTFPLPERRATLLLWSAEQPAAGTAVVRAAQLYELYDAEGRLEEKLWLNVQFRLVERAEFQAMAEAAGFLLEALYGDYDRSPFAEGASPFMIWVLEKSGEEHARAQS